MVEEYQGTWEGGVRSPLDHGEVAHYPGVVVNKGSSIYIL